MEDAKAGGLHVQIQAGIHRNNLFQNPNQSNKAAIPNSLSLIFLNLKILNCFSFMLAIS